MIMGMITHEVGGREDGVGIWGTLVKAGAPTKCKLDRGRSG